MIIIIKTVVVVNLPLRRAYWLIVESMSMVLTGDDDDDEANEGLLLCICVGVNDDNGESTVE